MRGLGVLFATLTLAASPSAAQQRTAQFSADGQSYTVDLPEGYCAEGRNIDSYLKNQEAMVPAERVPQLVMMRCGSEDTPFDLVSITLRPQYGSNNERASVFAAIGMSASDEATVIGKASEEVETRLSKALAARVQVNLGIGTLGVDEACGYLGGTLHFDLKGSAIDVIGLVCITVIDGRVFHILRYDRGSDPAKAAGMIPSVKALVLSIRTRR